MSSNFLMYQTEDGQTKIELRLEDETVWMTQKSLADLYQKSIKTISEHIKHIYDEGELTKEATIRKSQIVQTEGDREVTRESNFYNLEVIIAVGYRVRSHRGTQFRQWATDKINEYLVKGFVMDDARLKEMRNIGSDYFDELLERIRDIRASEKRFYIKITDIYATSVDYDPQAEITRTFFATVQNKLHYAIHGMTAAELIQSRADATQNNMGLQSFKGEKVRKNDVTIAKNYLTEKELKSLNRIVTMYLDYAEDQAERQQPMYMSDWIEKLDAFLQFNDRELLHNPGKVSKQVADSLAHSEYLNYNHARNRMNSHSDFLDFIKENDVKYFSDSD
ncbi:virulence RhuM family protein [Staphylococcus delphini]|uniref:virulence RhuM family protein n=1 Tax=Staphylococcus delphini TaxID=53344 RepID=UPI000BBCC7D8|nr:virulence RhuM family protein [Staphylococcus delphini]PCF41467.1 hydroxyacid dehydrogenase [Staphylococcus delphini]PCF47866.1 hydroxyacid dehydrogenase [Staphylococcus delphini]PCF52424.1 hydroxyacid dehydrogenase [Staphylococcus delphini]PCF57577.1 hydroxyacid dehydrogenase [Staphylococcus delphini]PCF59603.1 hydroxyacid dehydrogenase [Staphylococcus delphini]